MNSQRKIASPLQEQTPDEQGDPKVVPSARATVDVVKVIEDKSSQVKGQYACVRVEVFKPKKLNKGGPSYQKQNHGFKDMQIPGPDEHLLEEVDILRQIILKKRHLPK